MQKKGHKDYFQGFGVSDLRKLAKRAAFDSAGPNEFDYGHITGYAHEGMHSLGLNKIVSINKYILKIYFGAPHLIIINIFYLLSYFN